VNVRTAEEQPLDRSANGEGHSSLSSTISGRLLELIRLGKDRVLLHCHKGLCGAWLHIGRDARILGIIDAKFRSVVPGHYSGRVVAKAEVSASHNSSTRPANRQALKGLLRIRDEFRRILSRGVVD